MPDPRSFLQRHWPVAVFLLLFAVLVVLKGRFTAFDLRSLCVNTLPLALIALGQFMVILTRGIDLSLGPVASVTGTLMAVLMVDYPVPGFVLPILVGAAAGLANGLLIVGLRLPPIIVTLGTMSIWQGIALLTLPSPGGSIPVAYQQVLVGGFSQPVISVVTIVGWTLVVTWLMRTPFGLGLRAVGGDELAAGMSGVQVRLVKVLAYAIGGTLAGLGGMYMAVSMASGSPTIGDNYILTSISAVVIGGVALTGGRGSPVSVVMGALILTISASILYYAEVSSFYQSLIDGLILLAVVGSKGARDYLRGLVRV